MTNKNLFITLACLILLSSNVLAFAVSSKYWEENPLEMMPGETKDLFVTLQNMAGTETIEAEATIISEDNVAKITDVNKIYTVNAGEKTNVNLQVQIPKEAIKTNYKVLLSFKTKTTSEEAFGFGSAVEKEIPVVVKQPPREEKLEKTNYLLYGIIIVLVIILLIVLIPKLKHKKKK